MATSLKIIIVSVNYFVHTEKGHENPIMTKTLTALTLKDSAFCPQVTQTVPRRKVNILGSGHSIGHSKQKKKKKKKFYVHVSYSELFPR
jgi:hypothetical protein